jgi:hypothetical protein
LYTIEFAIQFQNALVFWQKSFSEGRSCGYWKSEHFFTDVLSSSKITFQGFFQPGRFSCTMTKRQSIVFVSPSAYAWVTKSRFSVTQAVRPRIRTATA